MSQHYLGMVLQFVREDGEDPIALDDLLERVLEQLDDLGVEAILTASLTQLQAQFLVPVRDDTLESIEWAVGTLRTALHGAYVGTAGWAMPTLRGLTPDELAAAS